MPSFLQNFMGLMQVKTQIDQQRLAERTQGSQMVTAGRALLSQLPREAREPFIQAFAGQTGLDAELLRQAAQYMPNDIETIKATMTEQGAQSINPAQVASAQLTGRDTGSLRVSNAIGGMEQPTIDRAAGISLGTQVGQPQIAQMGQQQGQFDRSLDLNESQFGRSQEQQANQFGRSNELGWANLRQGDRALEQQGALGMLNFGEKARQNAAGGGSSSTEDEDLKEVRQMMDMLTKGRMQPKSEGMIKEALRRRLGRLGYSPGQASDFINGKMQPSIPMRAF